MASTLQLLNAETDAVILPRLRLAHTFWQRFLGWQFRREVSANEGVLLMPCRSIHTFGMRFPIDVLPLDRDGHVLRTAQTVLPWRTYVGSKQTFAILEAASGVLACVPVGSTLSLTTDSSRKLPQVVASWKHTANS